MEAIAGKLAVRAREYGEKAQEAVKNLRPYVKKSMKDFGTSLRRMCSRPSVALVAFFLKQTSDTAATGWWQRPKLIRLMSDKSGAVLMGAGSTKF